MAEGQLATESGVTVAAEQVPPPVAQKRRPWRGLLETAGWTSLFFALALGWAWWQTGSASLVWPYLQGERLLIHPTNFQLGEQPVAAVIDCTVQVVNLTGADVTFLGAQKSCGCVTLDEFPLTVPSGQEKDLKISAGMPFEPGPFEQSVKFFTDEERTTSFAVTVTAAAR